ncbi:MAG: iron ABC transporter permease [Alphaproteobacteria bacterium]|nr:iron ABC transporter permease [Alphaproteobacteria bacterium]
MTSWTDPHHPAAAFARVGRRSRVGVLPALGIALAAVLCAPVAVVAASVVRSSNGVWAHLASTVLGDYVANTLLLMLGVGLGTAVGGVAAAWLVTMCRFPGSRALEWALVLPLAMPAYVVAYAYTDFLQVAGPLQTWLRGLTGWTPRDYWFPDIRTVGGAVTVMTFTLYPYVYLLARAAFLEQSVCVLEVGRMLGCGPWRNFLRVALPLARPAIVGGVALALMETLADFGTVQYFAVDTFTTGIYRTWFGMGEPVAAAQLAAVLMLFVLAVMLLERATRGQARVHHSSSRYRPLPTPRLEGWRALLAFAICAAPLALGFLLPVVLLLRMAQYDDSDMLGPRLLHFAGNSFLLAATVAALAVPLALLVAYGRRLHDSRVTALVSRIAGLGYAVPGTVIAVGVLIATGWLDHALGDAVKATTGRSVGLVFSGTMVAVAYGLTVRFLALGLNTVEASLAKIRPSLDQAARNLGLGPAAMLRRVHAPLMAGSIGTAALLVFVDTMKELSATILLRPFNFDTLAVQAANLAKDERLASAAIPSLAIVLVGVLPVLLLSRTIAKSRPGQWSDK